MGQKFKPFDLEAAKAGAPVMTRDGRPARILAFDLKADEYPIAAAIESYDGESEGIRTYTEYGKYDNTVDEHDNDLVMALVKHRMWANIHKSNDSYTLTGCHKTEESARWCGQPCSTYITTVPIEWEE